MVSSPHEDSDDDEQDPPPELDLHGLKPEQALRRLANEIHACRVRRAPELVVITGRGLHNPQGQPVLRERVAAWLASPEARQRGVVGHALLRSGGALLVRLRSGPPGGPRA